MADDQKTFSTVDYMVFVFTLVLSAGVGVFYAFTGGKQATTAEIFLADRKMGPWPVAASLLASFMSAITLLGLSAEIYNFGWDYILINIAFVMVIFASVYFYLPTFYHYQVTSSYEYLGRRFHRNVRVAGSVTFIIQMVFYLAIVLYAPALALNAVTGFSISLSILSIGLVCTFYTTVGGMKAVIWTDAIQCVFMFAGIIAVICKGAIEVGGLGVVFDRGIKGHRMEMFRSAYNDNLDVLAYIVIYFTNSFNPSPFERHTVWSIIFGGFFTWLAIFGVNQAQVQRCLSCPNLKTSKRAMYYSLPGLCALMTVCSFCGLIIYAIYWKCDPLTKGYIKSSDQLLPYVVMNIMNIPGIPGLFISSLFSGSLSTLSSGLNSLAAVTLEDIIKIYFYPKIPERVGSIVSKVLAVAFGVILIAFAFFSSLLGNVLQAALSIFGMVGGPLLGLFTLGMFFPWSNATGGLVGWISGMIISFWIGIGTSIYSPQYPKRPFSIEECPDVTMTTLIFANQTMSAKPAKKIFIMYWLSYLNLSFLSVAIVLIVGLVTSYFTGFQDPDTLDPYLISPPMRKFYCYLSKRYNFISFRPGSPAALLEENLESDIPLKDDSPLSESNRESRVGHSSASGRETSAS